MDVRDRGQGRRSDVSGIHRRHHLAQIKTVGRRELNPNDIAEEDADILNREVLPYWMERNVREYCRKTFGSSQGMRDAMENPDDYGWLLVRIVGL